VSKTGARKSPLNCTVNSRLKSLFFKNNRLKRYFPWVLAALPLELENRVRKTAIKAQIEPRILYLSGFSTLKNGHDSAI
jgi:hypothetical protein